MTGDSPGYYFRKPIPHPWQNSTSLPRREKGDFWRTFPLDDVLPPTATVQASPLRAGGNGAAFRSPPIPMSLPKTFAALLAAAATSAYAAGPIPETAKPSVIVDTSKEPVAKGKF